jgi:hypothetical protein
MGAEDNQVAVTSSFIEDVSHRYPVERDSACTPPIDGRRESSMSRHLASVCPGDAVSGGTAHGIGPGGC